MPTRSVVVDAAATDKATIGASAVSTKWSGMNNVEYPRPSMRRARSRQPLPSVGDDDWTPNRNGRDALTWCARSRPWIRSQRCRA